MTDSGKDLAIVLRALIEQVRDYDTSYKPDRLKYLVIETLEVLLPALTTNMGEPPASGLEESGDWVLVPKEPTPEMFRAAYNKPLPPMFASFPEQKPLYDAWKAMLAAAPIRARAHSKE